MAWNTKQVVSLRRTPTTADDPTDAGAIESLIAVERLLYVPVAMGVNLGDGGGTLIGGITRVRPKVIVRCLGFNRGAASGVMQSYGDMIRLIERVLVGPTGSYLYLFRAFEAGTNTNVPMARYDYTRGTPGSTTVAGSLWNLKSSGDQIAPETYPYSPAGLLPMKVVLDGEAEPDDRDDGTFGLEFTLYGVSPLVLT